MASPNYSGNASSGTWETLLDPQEKTAYVRFFRRADVEGKGVLLKDEAMAFLKKANVPDNILNEIWDAADNDKKGFLTDQEFCIALKLIACAQHGIIPASPVLKTQVPLPQLDGVPIPQTPPPVPSTNRPAVSSPNLQANLPATATANDGNDTILPEERSKFINIFQSSGPVDGVLQADQATSIFLRSNLPSATLHQVWALAATRKAGTLNQTEFIIAMHYISRALTGQSLPSSLPASIYAAAASGRMLSPVMASRSPTLQRQTTGVFTGHQSHHPGRSEMDISRDEFVKYKGYFDKLDTNRTGFISGGDAVVFFRYSKLPEADLARIWDLADTQQAGQLNPQQFAVAMHLINQRKAGGQIPSALPDHVFSQQPAFAESSAASQQLQQPQQQTTADLLGLGSDTNQQQPQQQQSQQQLSTSLPPHTQAQQPMATGNNFAAQRSELESNLASVRAETLNQTEHNNQLRIQLENENNAIRELQETLDREKLTLETLKQTALEAERQLAQAKEKKEGLTQDLQMYKQEAKHFQQRTDAAQQEIQQIQNQPTINDNNALTSPSIHAATPTAAVDSSSTSNNDFFTLSNAPPTELFAKVPDTTTQNIPTSPHSAGSPAPRSKTFDPFAGFKESNSKSATSSPTMSLNKLKEDAIAKQQLRTGSPGVDISAIEAKFPDLSTMEQNFQSPANTGNSAPGSVTTPVQSHATPTTPLQHNITGSQQMFGSPQLQSAKPTFVASPQLHNVTTTTAPPQTLSPSQAKSVAKYGFDLAAFEGGSSTSTPATAGTGNTGSSVKDDLNSLFGSPNPATAPGQPASSTSASPAVPQQQEANISNNNNSQFDDIFGVPSSSPSQLQQPQQQKPERKPTFDETFFS
ncbi:hypothetical protein BDA99DRAFT_575312 [Phascolomyces articulosus]|uniref:Uncharacterized protein n=1 Tax=Phascolomyces articulosus TaxID=60185 RepID=A0AAD5P9Q1_9FUNG|nr:hypothetical protein BDA99DRAFT_575312 [Phascolomyces articulosus]